MLPSPPWPLQTCSTASWTGPWRARDLKDREYIVPKCDWRRSCYAKYAAFKYWLLWATGTWKPANARRDVLWTSLTCLKFLQKELTCYQSPPGVSPTGKIVELSQARRLDVSTTPRHTLAETVTSPVYSSRGSFTLPKSHLLSRNSNPPTCLPTLPCWDNI